VYEHLLVALDGSPTAERVLDHAEALARAFGSTITLLRATISLEMLLAESAPTTDVGLGEIAAIEDPTPIVDADQQSATEYLQAVAARLRPRGATINIETPQGPADEVIVDRAKALDVSLILMTTHGRSGLGRVVFGSVADGVLRHTTSAVLLVRITE